MRKLLLMLTVLVAAVSCYDDSALWESVNDHEARISELERMCQQMNSNISSLQTIVSALQNNDYVTGVTPVIENGQTIGYTITFAKAQSITIYHGKDGQDGIDGTPGADGKDGADGAPGKDGQDGKNGKDGADGYVPSIGVRQDTDGVYYWTLDGDWLLDAGGNKIPTTGKDGAPGADGAPGQDGKDGQDGADGAPGQDGEDGSDGAPGSDGKDGVDGKDGITPQLKIEDGYWYVSYDNGSSWMEVGPATGAQGPQGEQGPQGNPGQAGDSFFQSITQDNEYVHFTLADGTVISVPKRVLLAIEFDSDDLVVMATNSTRDIHYTVTSVLPDVDVEVEAMSSADIKAKVIADDAYTGVIRVKTGDTIDEYSKVVVLVSNGEKVIMKTLTFEEEAIEVIDDAMVVASAEGGEVELVYLSNVDCEVVIPEEAQSWISVAPATRAMEERTITLKLEPNTGYYRSAIITVQSPGSTLKLEYQVEQDGDLGVEIDPTQIPDNEIWYTTTDGEIIPFHNLNPAGMTCENTNASLVSNTYSNGVGILKFDNTLTVVDHLFDSRPETLKTIYFPNSLTELGFKNLIDNGSIIFELPPLFHHCENLEYCYLPDSIERMGLVFFNCEMLQEIRIPDSLQELSGLFTICPNMHTIKGNHSGISEDGKTFTINNTLFAFAPKDITSYTINEGITSITGGVFRNCQLSSIKFPETLQSIGGSCFSGSSIESLSLTANLQYIGDEAFANCDNLRTVFIEESVQDIDFGYSIFSDCDNIEEFKGKYASDDGLFMINDGEIVCIARKTLNSLSTLEFPDGISIIGANTFSYLDNLEHIRVGDGVVLIGNNAFRGCSNLKTIYIPGSVESYGSAFLADCPNLEAIYGPNASEDNRYILGKNYTTPGWVVPQGKWYGWKDNTLVAFAPKNIEEYTFHGDINGIGFDVFSGASNLKSITVKSPITHVLDGAFSSCPMLKIVDLPESVILIGNDAFAGTEQLTKLIIRAINPPYMPSEWLVASGLYNAEILVPNIEYCIEAYKREWPELASRIKGEIEVDSYISSDYSQNGVVTILQTASKGNGIDIVLMGDAYSDRQIADGSYAADMEFMYDKLFSEEPFKTHKDMFNVYYVNVVSATEGYESGVPALGGYFGEGTLVGGNDNKCFEYALNAIAEDKMDEVLIIVGMNSDAYAGTCYMYVSGFIKGTYGSGPAVAYFPRGGNAETFAQLLHHEACGHGFAKLADEYAYEYMGTLPSDYVSQIQGLQNEYGWYKNVDFTNDPSQVRWSYFLEDERYQYDGLGCFEGGLTYWSGVWRPTENSIMRYNTGGFNAPSREAIWYRIHKLAYGDSWEYNYEDFVEYDAINRASSSEESVAARRKRANYVERTFEPTAPPVIMNKSWRDAK